MDSYIGILEKTRNGNGFVRCNAKPDIFVHMENMNNAMHGDTVRVNLFPSEHQGRSPEGRIERIEKRADPNIVGTYKRIRGKTFVIPINRHNHDWILIPSSEAKKQKIRPGDKVVAHIKEYPKKHKSHATGTVTQRIAGKDSPKGEIKALILANGLNEHFSPEIETYAARAASRLPAEEDLRNRMDLRDQTIITIDGADAKDLDDAVSIRKTAEDHYILGVHIADVAHYTPGGSPLDREACLRGTSIYLLTKVIPMLPRSLSNGICSLFEGTDRLTISCIMEFDKKGTLLNYEIEESIINSKARMIYDDASDILEHKNPDTEAQYRNKNGRDIVALLELMNELASILKKKRIAEGSIDFDLDEAEITLDENDFPIAIRPADRRCANNIIEEFMLAANRTVAGHYYQMESPCAYRVHDKPDSEKIRELRTFLQSFGIRMKGTSDKITPSAVNTVLKQIKGSASENIISTVLLKSMTKAYYSPECRSHFGLAFPHYCHFTSPIRRYPDLLVHRVIKTHLHAGNNLISSLQKIAAFLPKSCETSSIAERKAQELERDIEKYKKAQFMTRRIGSVYDGTVSGITDYGFYVRLTNTVEGLVRLETLNDDHYEPDDARIRLTGAVTGKQIALGDPFRIKVISADPELRQIDFIAY